MLKKIGKFLLVLVVLGISMGLILYPAAWSYNQGGNRKHGARWLIPYRTQDGKRD